MKIVRYIFLLGVVLLLFWLLAGCQSGASLQTTTGEPAFELSVDILGRTHIVSLDSEGRLSVSASLASPDGTVILSIDKGTRLLNKDGKPLSSIWVKNEQDLLPLSESSYIIGTVYSLAPQDATFNSPLKLTLSYDPQEIPEGVRENDVYIAPYDENTGWGSYNYKRVETDKHRVTTQIETFTRYAVQAPTKASYPQPTKQTTSAPGLTSITLVQALSNGKPTLAEFGRGTCIPCKQMKPILESLAVEYQDRLNVPIVSVDEYRDLTNYYKVMAIPTQIGFDSSCKEVFRHVGFWPKDLIVAQLSKLGIK